MLERWKAERLLQRRAAAYVGTLREEPSEADVTWLATQVTGGDLDRARWELRYARRALGLLVAERDALDDRTASAVARELTASLERDRNIAADKLAVAEKQLNARLRAYGAALASRDVPEPTGARLGRALLAVAGRADITGPGAIARAGEILTAFISEANEALRREFGAASLPEHLPPSAVQGSSGT